MAQKLSTWHSEYYAQNARPTQFGFISELNIMSRTDTLSSWVGPSKGFIPNSPEIEFTCVIPSPTPAIFDLLHTWMRSSSQMQLMPEEFRCLYCGSVNTVLTIIGVIRTHCTQCGAPRSYILG